MLLADQGAEVVKVEPPSGEETRFLEPKVGVGSDAVSAYFLRYNRSKQSICIDLRSDGGRAVLERLAQHADVLVENFRPGVMERLGFTAERLAELNQRLIYCTITGFGHSDSELRDRPAFTPIVEAMAAAMIHGGTENDPTIAGYPVGDIFPAALAAGAIGMALYRRERDGAGARIDIAMYDAMISMNERAIGMTAMVGRDHYPGIPGDLGSAPSGVFRAVDGLMTIAIVGEPMWQKLCDVLGRADWAQDERLGSGASRAAVYETVIRPGIQTWLASRTRAEAVQSLTEAGIPAAQVARPSEVIASAHARSRGMIVDFPTRSDGETLATVAGNPIHFAGEQGATAGAAPAPGEHSTDVLRSWAGLGETEIEQLLEETSVIQGGR
jgi:crotonobetainyl-CoA:carnitine CoA-transferase CaiB-like acyl-CoA transferase